MLHLRCLTLCLSTSLLLAFPTSAQVPQNEGEVDLSATETYAVLAPAITSSTLIPFQVDVEGRDSDGFDVTVANAGAVVSLILPGGTEVNSLNADSLGFDFEVTPADSETTTSGLFISFFSLSGTHTTIRLPSTSPAGTYQIEVNTASVATATPVYASYLSGSPIRAALSPDATSYQVGNTVILSAFIFNGTTPVNVLCVMRRAGFPHRYDEAIQYCQRALLLEPNFLDALLLLGLSYEQKGMLEEAMAQFSKAKDANTDATEPLELLGHVLAIAGLRDEARWCCQSFIHPRNKTAFIHITSR